MAEENSVVATHRKSSRLYTFLSIIYLLITIILVIGIGLLWNDHSNLSNRVRQLHNQLNQQQQTITIMQNKVQALTTPQEKRIRVLSETEYLAQLASLNLDYQNNVPLATKLLTLADQQLASLSDPALTNIRQSLNNAITELQAVPKIDLTGLVVRLNALSQQIPQLPLIPQHEESTTTTAPTTTNTQPQSMWKKGLIAIGHAFKNVVVVRRLEQPIEPLISPEQQTFLIQNIQFKLSQAEWAALHQQVEIYQQSLQQIAQWIQQYFVQNNSSTQSVLHNIEELKKVNVKPILPNLSNSLTLIQDALKQS